MTAPLAAQLLLDGPKLRTALAAAAQHLRDASGSIDAINVYPIPDGDTGANMSGTLREAVEGANALGVSPTVGEVLRALARGALYGARGNSGVILSQALRGFAIGVGDPPAVDAAGLAAGLGAASIAAYAAVSQPAEGTMLTVLRRAAEAAMQFSTTLPRNGGGVPCVAMLSYVVAAAEVAQVHTTGQLAALAEAGVPDAGGEGICVILRGLLAGISDKGLEVPEVVRPVIRPAPSALASDGHAAFGFCTEFIVEPGEGPIDIARLRELAGRPGNSSVMVVGDQGGVRVHAHTPEPDALIASAEQCGRLTRLKVEDMDAQHARFRASGGEPMQTIGVLALSRGAGFDAAFEGLGAAVCDLSQAQKPAAGEIAAAADALHLSEVIVLPNHPNVLLAAQQAVELTRCTLHVVPTRSLPQGIAAVVAFDPRRPSAANVGAMQDAAKNVRTIEVATAVVSQTSGGIVVREGQSVAFLDGELVAATETALESLVSALEIARAAEAALVTLYRGTEATQGDAETIRDAVAARFAEVEIELVDGGQGLYTYIASVEG